ncbi:hypothetical protein GALMADRAFT_1358664 [Galerina marginata CBS 339.88]|uniref:Uncharacterized protein n=1 Tax=Galerina marginata (strain CBS 339.88) TaxID=685588 RepID=A0A067SKM0_GALM3|nr:hypothetical protein GALMADRAFT_1358664 [Galerina marginata CBS 339.88]
MPLNGVCEREGMDEPVSMRHLRPPRQTGIHSLLHPSSPSNTRATANAFVPCAFIRNVASSLLSARASYQTRRVLRRLEKERDHVSLAQGRREIIKHKTKDLRSTSSLSANPKISTHEVKICREGGGTSGSMLRIGVWFEWRVQAGLGKDIRRIRSSIREAEKRAWKDGEKRHEAYMLILKIVLDKLMLSEATTGIERNRKANNLEPIDKKHAPTRAPNLPGPQTSISKKKKASLDSWRRGTY